MMIDRIVKYYLHFKWNIRKLIQDRVGKKSCLFINYSISYPDKSLIQPIEKNLYAPATKESEENKVIQNDAENMITNMCILINETIRQSLPEFRSSEIYNQLCTKPISSYIPSSIEKEVTTLFESSICMLRVVCPVLNEFEICLLILIKADLQLSVICTYLGIDDPPVLYQRKYRMKKKICNQLYGETIYALLLGNK